jgi:microcystin-dependent protein
MADTRAADDPVDALAQLQQQFADLQSTVNARISRCPTGTLEPTFLSAPKADTLLCNGATINRADYPALFQWASDNSLLGSVFGNGNGSTTFVLPDMRGAVLRVPAAGGTVGEKLGADSRVLTTANMPAHTHSVSVDDHASHMHHGITAQDGAHGGHFPGSQFIAAAGADYGLAAWNSGGVGSGTHNHGFDTDSRTLSSHVVHETSVGSGTAIDLRQASFGLNVLIWT